MSPPVLPSARVWSSWGAPIGLAQARKRSRTGSYDQDDWTVAPVFVCDRLEDWLQPEGWECQGLLARRPPTWGDIQATVDAAVARGAFGREEGVKVSVCRGPYGDFGDFGAAAEGLVRQVDCLPDEIAAVIAADTREIGAVLAQMCPGTDRMEVKLEIMGESCCSRWHRDRYNGRAIVTYNADATNYTSIGNVNEWELENCGNNDHIIRDPSQVCSVGLGDALFIKGSLFPADAKGLIHKSPEKRYHPSGKIMNRLVLKVDVP